MSKYCNHLLAIASLALQEWPIRKFVISVGSFAKPMVLQFWRLQNFLELSTRTSDLRHECKRSCCRLPEAVADYQKNKMWGLAEDHTKGMVFRGRLRITSLSRPLEAKTVTTGLEVHGTGSPSVNLVARCSLCSLFICKEMNRVYRITNPPVHPTSLEVYYTVKITQGAFLFCKKYVYLAVLFTGSYVVIGENKNHKRIPKISNRENKNREMVRKISAFKVY